MASGWVSHFSLLHWPSPCPQIKAPCHSYALKPQRASERGTVWKIGVYEGFNQSTKMGDLPFLFLLRTKLGLKNGLFWPMMGCPQSRCRMGLDWQWFSLNDLFSPTVAKGCVSSEGQSCESKAQKASVGDVKGATFIFHPRDTLMVGPLVTSSTPSRIQKWQCCQKVSSNGEMTASSFWQKAIWFGWLVIYYIFSTNWVREICATKVLMKTDLKQGTK